MKKSNLFIIFLVILVVIGAWSLLFSRKIQDRASIKKQVVSPVVICQQLGGELREDACQVGEMIIMNQELPFFQERIASCQQLGGLFLGGDSMACKIEEEIYPNFSWERIDSMKDLCLENQGEWLGGVDFQCEIEGELLSGNWSVAFILKDSCLDSGGEWLGNKEVTCQIDGQNYQEANWLRIDEMKTSCDKYGGQWQGGNDFTCILDNTIYTNKLWERSAVAPQIGERCEVAGGTWLAQYQECEGLDIDWCIEAESAFAEIRGLRFDQCLSACRHTNSEICTEQCVPVCSLNMTGVVN